MTVSFQTAYAMPPYGFGGAGSSADTVHIDMSMGNTDSRDAVQMNISHADAIHFDIGVSNRDTIHMDIGSYGAMQQNIPRNGERIGTLTIPSGRQIAVFGGESIRSMGKGAGHFSDTGLNFGNTALIGHNRGNAGFFIFVKDLQVGQMLALEANGITKTYVVAEMYKIHATDTDLLMHFGDSRLSLFTCWEDARDYRRVVVAYETEGAE
jgi:LPXTG-site transpeptidase (sortase) family protein